MARSRGLQTFDRLALDWYGSTGSQTLVASPCFVYEFIVTLTDTNATGTLTLADSSASADAAKESTKAAVLRLGAGGVSAGGNPVHIRLSKPWHIRNTLVSSATGINVSVGYLPVS